MTSSSSYSNRAPASYAQSCHCDVFLSFRGEDTRKTFVDHLYSALVDRAIPTYKDDETLPRGESIRPSLFKAIKGSKVAVIIFSTNYANSSWCLEELEYIMRCKDKRGLIVMPIFYDVVPSEVRKQEGAFGKGFFKQKVRNVNKADSWRNALIEASEIAGWEPKNISNGHESKVIKDIVDTISDKLFSLTSTSDEDHVGMRARLQELEAQLQIGSHGVQMVGIWGVGGSGKTTLAYSVYMKISGYFQGHCIVDNIREESSKYGLKTLQEKILSRLVKTEKELQNVEEGKFKIKSRLRHSNVLIVLDDVDDRKQLDALAGSHNWFGSGSRIIITTRDEHLLISHKVDHVYPVKLLSKEEAIQLFNKRAYNEKKPVKDYKTLSLNVVSYAAGLPLALKVLSSFLYDKDEKEWMSSLARLKDIPKTEILKQLKISYDGLETVEKELFLDIACFFRRTSVDEAIEILEACDYHPRIGVKVLREKALVTIVDGEFDMHDLVQEMAHYIVRGEHPNNPEKHSRVWKHKEIRNMCIMDARMENEKIEAIKYFDTCGHSSLFCKIVSNMKKLRWLYVSLDIDYENAKGPNFLSNELRYIQWEKYPRSPFPDSFQPMKLVALKLSESLQKELWKGFKHLPCLKVLELDGMMNLLSTPDFYGLPCLQKLTIRECEELEEIHPSLGKHTTLEYLCVSVCGKLRMFPTIVQMGKLKTLEIRYCHNSLEFPDIKSNLESLVKLSLSDMLIDNLLSSVGERCANLVSLNLVNCFYSKIREVSFDGLKHLEELTLNKLDYMKISDHIGISLRNLYESQLSISLRLVLSRLTHRLQKLDLGHCSLRDGEIPPVIGELTDLRELNLSWNDFTRLDVSLSRLTRLKLLNMSDCKQLVELPELPSCIISLKADRCNSLRTTGEFYTNCKWLCEVSLVGGGIINNDDRLIQSMIERRANENRCMVLQFQGPEIAKGFGSPLLVTSRYRMKLPENWCNDFSGFLICAALTSKSGPQYIGMYNLQLTCPKTLINSGSVMSALDSEDDVVSKETDHRDNDRITWLGYVSFSVLRHTAWWDETCKEVLFSIHNCILSSIGFGVRLIARKSGSGPTETSKIQEESESSHYTPDFKILHDSANALEIGLKSM